MVWIAVTVGLCLVGIVGVLSLAVGVRVAINVMQDLQGAGRGGER